jgi:transcriptional regulator with XRE-family HTH domain
MNKKLMIEVGKRIREVRHHLQLNQTDFAGLIGMPIKQLSGIENGKITPGFDFLYKVEEIFNVNLSYIITGKRSISDLREIPTINMCEILLKKYNQEFRKFIKTMHKSHEICRYMFRYFFIYMVEKGYWKN